MCDAELLVPTILCSVYVWKLSGCRNFEVTVREAEGLEAKAGVVLHLILPHSLRCPADTYFTQVAMHYPHLHRPQEQTVAFGHYEDPPEAQAVARQCQDMQGKFYSCTGYRLLNGLTGRVAMP